MGLEQGIEERSLLDHEGQLPPRKFVLQQEEIMEAQGVRDEDRPGRGNGLFAEHNQEIFQVRRHGMFEGTHGTLFRRRAAALSVPTLKTTGLVIQRKSTPVRRKVDRPEERGVGTEPPAQADGESRSGCS